MQEGDKNLGMLKIVQFGQEIFTLSPVPYVTIELKKLVSEEVYVFNCAIFNRHQQ